MSDRFYSRIFHVAAAWNIVGGVVIFFGAGWIFGAAGLAGPEPAAYFHAWIVLFMTFGVGYYLVARDLYGRRDIVLLGIIGKLAFSAVFLAHMTLQPGTIPGVFLIAVVGDLVFVVLFVMFLRRERAPALGAGAGP